MNNILTLFSEGTNVMTTEGSVNVHNGDTTNSLVNPDYQTYYSAYLIDNAEPSLVHAQFGQKRPIPKNGGKTVEFPHGYSLSVGKGVVTLRS